MLVGVGPAARSPRNTPGIVSLVLAIGILVTNLVSDAVNELWFHPGDFRVYDTVESVLRVTGPALGIGAIIFGGIGLARRRRPKRLAAAAGLSVGIYVTGTFVLYVLVFFGFKIFGR